MQLLNGTRVRRQANMLRRSACMKNMWILWHCTSSLDARLGKKTAPIPDISFIRRKAWVNLKKSKSMYGRSSTQQNENTCSPGCD
jgi:hypothetical protein